jgi:hypothetical protein
MTPTRGCHACAAVAATDRLMAKLIARFHMNTTEYTEFRDAIFTELYLARTAKRVKPKEAAA